jgi:glycosyltransferase involved in cell wall biosynthesis
VFLVSRTPQKLGSPIFHEVERRALPRVFYSDFDGWERLGKPKSARQFTRVLAGLWRGNLDTLRAVRAHPVLYVPNLFAASYAALAIVYSRLRRRRVVFHFHELVDRPSAALRALSWFVTDVIHNSERSAQLVVAANPFLSRKRSHVIPYPLPSRGPAAGSDPAVDAAFANAKNIICVGRVSWRKGVDVLLDAFDRLARTCRDVTLHLVGGGDEPELAQRIASTTFANGCRVHPWGYRSDVLALIKRADLYVMPTPPSRVHESFGIGMLEAMSLGVPGVCFASGALKEIVVNEETGLVCERESPDALAAALERLLADERFRRACGQRARRRFLERYSPQLVKARWLEVFGDPRRRLQFRAASF